MNEPRRLVDEGGSDDLELALLRSARRDAPSARARRRTLVALGLGTGALGATGAVGTSTAAAASATATAAGVGVLKWIGIGVVAGLFTVGGVEAIREPRETSARSTQNVAATRPALGLEAPAAQLVPGRDPSSPSLDRAESAEVAPGNAAPAGEVVAQHTVASAAGPAAPRPAGRGVVEPVLVPAAPSSPEATPVAPAAAGKPTLADEVAALDRAREALQQKDPAAALAALEKHDAQFAGGTLGPEATVLRIEATLARGDRAGAARLAAEFLATHPRSPHASRVRSVLAEASVRP